MFGYIRPQKGELKVCEFERFKACYCGLCGALGKKYGPAARFILNFELVHLAMLLWDENEAPVIERKRCVASPCRKKMRCARNAVLDACAGYSVILAWWKLRDTIEDEPFIKAVPHRLGALFLKGAYKKAVRELPGFDAKVRQELTALSEFEKSGGASLDGAADKFAKILSFTVPDSVPESKRRALAELLYHTGRWIYIIDACDDYEPDVEAGRYNAAAARFPPQGGKLQDGCKRELEMTLIHSNNLVCDAFELMPENPWTHTVRNTLYLGMPYVCDRVLDGTWLRRDKRQKPIKGLDR